MLTLQLGDTTDNIVVTLKEKSVLINPYYLFVFQHITTKQIISFIAGTDLSVYPDRYSEFAVSLSLFTVSGQYVYHVYEQASNSNLDPTGLNLVENGRMHLLPTSKLSYTKYSPVNQFTTYGG